MNKRLHSHKKADSSASNPVKSQFQSRPFIAQAKPQSEKPLTQTETENEEFQQQKFEATQLNLQAKTGTITPEGQERLTVLQAKMSGTLQRRLEHASSNGSNFANIPRSRPDAPSQLAVQTKLTIGEPGDKFEKAADKAAEDFVKQYHAPVSQQAERNLQPSDKLVEEKELQRKPMLQLRSAKVGMTAAPEVEAAIKQARGGGQSMPEKIRQPYEQHAGADYSRVKIHTDRRADLINRSIGAEACTIGTDVLMRSGNYKPGTKKGDELLRHELEHVGQQKGSEVQAKPDIAQRTPDKDGQEVIAHELDHVELQKGNTIQLTVAEDSKNVGLASIYEKLQKSEKGKKLIEEADKLNVKVSRGKSAGRAFTARGIGEKENTISIYIPQGINDEKELLTCMTFELNNAIHQNKFDDLKGRAESGQVSNEREYAKEKIKIELIGMLRTGLIGLQLVKKGELTNPGAKMYLPTYLNYRKERDQKGDSYTWENFAEENADTVLDRAHENNPQNTHRAVYEEQYRQIKRKTGTKERRELTQVGPTPTQEEIIEIMDWTSDKKEYEEMLEKFRNMSITEDTEMGL
jgi:hypothetical protein